MLKKTYHDYELPPSGSTPKGHFYPSKDWEEVNETGHRLIATAQAQHQQNCTLFGALAIIG